MTRKRTWILVADAGRARVIEQLGHEDELTIVDVLEHPMAKTSDKVRDALPRTFDSVGSGRHAIAPKSDPHRADKKKFAHDLADMLDAALAMRAFDRLVVVAPPQMVGDLRPALSEPVKSRLKHELLLDLTHAPVHEIARRLKEDKVA